MMIRASLEKATCLLMCWFAATYGPMCFRSGTVRRSLLCRPQGVGDTYDQHTHCGPRLIRSLGQALVGVRRLRSIFMVPRTPPPLAATRASGDALIC